MSSRKKRPRILGNFSLKDVNGARNLRYGQTHEYRNLLKALTTERYPLYTGPSMRIRVKNHNQVCNLSCPKYGLSYDFETWPQLLEIIEKLDKTSDWDILVPTQTNHPQVRYLRNFLEKSNWVAGFFGPPSVAHFIVDYTKPPARAFTCKITESLFQEWPGMEDCSVVQIFHLPIHALTNPFFFVAEYSKDLPTALFCTRILGYNPHKNTPVAPFYSVGNSYYHTTEIICDRQTQQVLGVINACKD